MVFVEELPELEGFNTILVIMDQFTKAQHYFLAKTTWMAEDVANSFINDIWKLYGVLRHITSDRGLQFASKFLKELSQKLNINLRLSTAYQLQTDELNKQAVQILK